MSDEKTVESLVAGRSLLPDQWYAVKAIAFVRRTAAGRVETKGLKVSTVAVDSPDAPLPPDEGEGTPEPEPKA